MHTDTPNSRPSPRARRAAVIACTALLPLLCASAQAQSVRKCVIDGRLVLQASPCPLPARAAAAVAPPAAAASQAVADSSGAPKKKTLADLLRERDAADRAQPAPRETESDGFKVLRSRMGAV